MSAAAAMALPVRRSWRPATSLERALAIAVPGLPLLWRGKVRYGALLLAYLGAMALVVLHDPRHFLAGLVDWSRHRLDHHGASLAVLGVLAALAVMSWRATVRPPPALRDAGIGEWQLVARQFRRNGLAVAGLNLMLGLYLVALLAPLLAPYDPDWQQDIFKARYLPPSAEHWMGTDYYSRDVLSRVLYGSRISLSIGFVAVAISITIGTAYGAASGYVGGKLDGFLMRTLDMLLSFPRLVLLLAIINFFRPSIFLIVAILGLTGWMGTARLVRGQVLSLREQEFMQACRALGATPWRAIARHLIPNTVGPIVVSATLGIGGTILTEAALSFLGLGVPPPTSTWGTMVNEGKDALTNAWWVTTFPGLAVVVAVAAFNLVGDGLGDAIDPRRRTK